MKLAFATLALRLPSVVPEQVSYTWNDINYEQYISEPSAAWGIGIGGELGALQGPAGAFELALGAELRRRNFESDFPLDFYTLNVPLDLGYRWDTATMGAQGPFSFWFGGALGPRVSYLSVPSWPDLVAIGWGLDTFLGVTIGTGPVRANAGVRFGFDWSGGGSYGNATVPDGYVYWTYTSGGIVASVQAGVELR